MVKLTDITFDKNWVYAHAYDCDHKVECDIKINRKKEIFEPMDDKYYDCRSAIAAVRYRVSKGLIKQHDNKTVAWG